MKPLKTKVSITLDTDIIEKLKELAEKDDRSFSLSSLVECNIKRVFSKRTSYKYNQILVCKK